MNLQSSIPVPTFGTDRANRLTLENWRQMDVLWQRPDAPATPRIVPLDRPPTPSAEALLPASSKDIGREVVVFGEPGRWRLAGFRPGGVEAVIKPLDAMTDLGFNSSTVKSVFVPAGLVYARPVVKFAGGWPVREAAKMPGAFMPVPV